MTITDGDTEYRVWWDHRDAPSITWCYIKIGQRTFTPDDWKACTLQYGGATMLNPKDRYNRSTGRKVSLARALTNAGVTRVDQPKLRRRFFDTYRESRGKW